MESLNTIERQQEIVRLTQEQGKVSVTDLSQRFGVSEVTIRSDLAILDKKRLVVRSRGGAMINDDLSRELSFKEKRQKHSDLKQKLGRAAAALIADGDRIILDSGTTTEEVAACLGEHQNLIVMTNGLNIATELAAFEKVEVMLTGGLLRKKSMSFYGAQAEQALRHFQFDKVVLGVDGFDIRAGISTHFEAEATLNRLMCEVAREIIVVTDSSKFERHGFHLICVANQIHTLVTDAGIPAEIVEELIQMGVQVQIIS